MFDKLIIPLLFIGHMYNAQGEGKVAAANTEIIKSPYFKYGTQDTASLKGAICKKLENKISSTAILVKIVITANNPQAQSDSDLEQTDLVLNFKLGKAAFTMKGPGRTSDYETVYSLILDSISIPQEVDEEYGKAIGQILWDYYENNNSKSISWQFGSDSSALDSESAKPKQAKLCLETLSGVAQEVYTKLTQLFKGALSRTLLDQLVSNVNSIIVKAQATQNVSSKPNPRTWFSSYMPSFPLKVQPNQDKDEIVKKALNELNNIVQNYCTLENDASKITSFFLIYRELKTIEKSKPGTFNQALDEFRTALPSLRIYDVFQGIMQHIDSRKEENPTLFEQQEVYNQHQILLNKIDPSHVLVLKHGSGYAI